MATDCEVLGTAYPFCLQAFKGGGVVLMTSVKLTSRVEENTL